MDIRSTDGRRHPWGDAASPFEALGGDEGVKKLAWAFYDAVEADAPVLRAMLPRDTAVSRQKLYEFLSGWSGGPQLYWERRGHPALSMRHAPFPIDEDAAASWVSCLGTALDVCGVQEPTRRWFVTELGRAATMLINRE